jgi:N-acetyl-gamma-glutamyl-phosphate/LysW-gamma-L-alpha-aminoadipyl-6-phosphate reductase
MSLVRATIVGGSGYAGGELIRLLLFHEHIEIAQVISRSHAGQFVHSVHPNLRKQKLLRFSHPDALEQCDVLFLCLPHGVSSETLNTYQDKATHIIDLSADFRIHDQELYQQWYNRKHPATHYLAQSVYGLPELHRSQMPGAKLVSGTGCMATCAILGLAPLYQAGLVDMQIPLVLEAKSGSSAAGVEPKLSSHHPERSGALRSFQPTGHRHTAELIQELGLLSHTPLEQSIAFSATSVELVRGILVTAHVFLQQALTDKDIWSVYRKAYQKEPFIRLVKEQSGVFRYPEPKLLMGTNYCDIGFELDRGQKRVVVISALDNLMKGAAGNAVQALNCVFGWEETTSLTFPGLHPV